MSTLVLKNAVVKDGTGGDPIVNGSVVLEGDRIKEVLFGPSGQLPSDAQIIDCRNQTLLPGLIDGHVHLGAVDANIMEQQRLYHPSTLVIRTLKVIREAQRQGLIPGPRMFVSGCALSQTGGHGDFRLPTEVRM